MQITKWKPIKKLPVRFRKDKDRVGRAWFSDRTKLKAVKLWISGLSLVQVSEQLNVPYTTVRNWKYQSEWWDKIVDEVIGEQNQGKDAKLEQLVNKSYNALDDRIDHGDFVLDSRSGEILRVPMKGKELAIVSKSLHAQQQELREIPVKQAAQQATNEMLVDLAKQFAEIAQGKKSTSEKVISAKEIEDVEYHDVKENNGTTNG